MSSADSDEQLVARVRGGERRRLRPVVRAAQRRGPSRRQGCARRRRPTSTMSWPKRSPRCSERCSAGTDPTEGFVGYLVSTVRHEAYRANRRRRDRPVGDRTHEPAVDPFAGREDADILRAAFGSLPSVARDVLWRTEVEGRSHADIARTVGSTTQAIGARASRARVALGGAYLAGHLDLAFDEPPSTPQCSEVRAQLVDLVRGERERPAAAGAGGAPRPVRAVPRWSPAPRTIQRAVAHGAAARPGRCRWIGLLARPAGAGPRRCLSPPPRSPSWRSWLRRSGRPEIGSSNDEPATTAPATTEVVRHEPADDHHAAAGDGGDRSVRCPTRWPIPDRRGARRAPARTARRDPADRPGEHARPSSPSRR